MSRQEKKGGRKSVQSKSRPTVYEGDVTLADFANSTAIKGKLRKAKTFNLVREVKKVRLEDKVRSFTRDEEPDVDRLEDQKEVKKLSVREKAWDEDSDDDELEAQNEGRTTQHPNIQRTQLPRFSANFGNNVPTTSAEKVDDSEKKVKKVDDNSTSDKENIEQFRLRDNLRIHGLKEKVGEKTVERVLDMCRNRLKIELSAKDIIKAERIGKQLPPGEHRSVLVTFATHGNRNKVYFTRKKLKGSRMSISEDLTPQRLALFRRVVELNGLKHTWTAEGKVKWADNEGIIHTATRLADLEPPKEDLPN